ncbi:hypothetical protein ACWDBD_48480 [Streptomyces sp. NPDC001118]
MRPADQDLSCGDRTDAKQLQEFGGLLADELEEFVLQLAGLGLEVPDAPGS